MSGEMNPPELPDARVSLPAEPVRKSQLDGLRGFAAIAVIVFHCILDRDPTLNERIVRPPLQDAQGIYDVIAKLVFMIASGETAIIVFFVLSGTVLFESLCRRQANLLPTAAGFCLRRFLRLYPTFFFFLGAALAAFALTGAYATMMPHFWPNALLRDFSILGASWTLQIEFLAIPFILIAFWCYRRWNVVGILISYGVFAILLYTPSVRLHFVLYQRFLSCFVLGMLIPTAFGATIARRLPIWCCPVVVVALLAVRHLMGLHWWTMKIAQVLAALLIVQLYYGRSGGLGRILDQPIPQYLGRISYSLYLGNIACLVLAAHWTSDVLLIRNHPIEWGIGLSLPIIATTITIAHFAERCLERPLIDWARRLTRFSASEVVM